MGRFLVIFAFVLGALVWFGRTRHAPTGELPEPRPIEAAPRLRTKDAVILPTARVISASAAPSPLLPVPDDSVLERLGWSEEWPGWRCADLDGPERKSLWVLGNATTGDVYEGSCDEWSRKGQDVDPEVREAIRIARSLEERDFRAIEGWEEWKCAEDPRGANRSFWSRKNSSEMPTPYEGNCDSWRRPAGSISKEGVPF